MRLIWKTELTAELLHFQEYLHSKGIETLEEVIVDSNWDSDDYGIKVHKLWIYDEDRFHEAQKYLADFLQNLPKITHKPPLRPKPSQKAHRHVPLKQRAPSRFSLSNIIILICSTLLLACMWTEKPIHTIPPQLRSAILTASPVEKALLFDYPESYELLDKLTLLYGYDTLLTPSKLPGGGQFLYTTYLHTPTWQGIYPYLTSHFQKPFDDAPLFEKIREGEVWRLVSPIFLHADFLHLFFNMVWLILIGNEMEMHLSTARYIIFILIAAICSNTAQYLMSGCAFIGFSGVICAIAFFIYARQKVAPWEGYHLPRATLQFLLFFICGLAVLSFITFIIEFFQLGVFPIQIANTAHLVGAGVGYGLGRLRFFSTRQ